MARMIGDHLGTLGYATTVVDSGARAIEVLRGELPDLVITDLRMADVDGLDVLDAARAVEPDLPVIVMTAFGAIDSAIESMRRGAFHYLVKPIRLDELGLHVHRALEQRRLRRDHRRLIDSTRVSLVDLVGATAAMRRIYELVDRIAPAAAAVLVRGESGTGKELVARAIHDRGPRRDRPFIAVNCTALPDQLLESELFGHTRGAFSGAVSARAGLFVEASGGTLFLDEIGDMPAPLQARLLRVLQDGEVRAVGSDAARSIDVRVVAATHQDLESKVEDGSFRADLFYRLDVVQLMLPPLREHLEDVPILVDHFLARARQRNPQSPVVRVSQELVAMLMRYAWPGNVRELQNLIERMVVVGAKPELSVAELAELAPRVAGGGGQFALPRDRFATLHEVEDEYIAWMIDQCGGNKTRAAERLGVDPSTLHRRARAKRG
jgi:two-component system response regulator HydG